MTSAPPSVTITYATPTAGLSSSALSFGSEAQGSVSTQQVVTVTNTGGAALLVTGVQTGGTNPGDYLIADGCQQPVAPGAGCQIGVRFVPQAQGASSATLTILTNAPAMPAPVTLSGTGTALAAGATGATGATGPQGPAGPRGAIGAAGTIACRTTLVAQALCTLEFVPGTFTAHGSFKEAAFRIERAGRTVAAGTVNVRAGKVSRAPVGRLRRGRYTLIISTGRGRAARVLLKEPVAVA